MAVMAPATALSTGIENCQQAVKQILALPEPERAECLNLLRETRIVHAWVQLGRTLLDAVSPLNPYRQAEIDLKLLINARRTDRALRKELMEKRQRKRGLDKETKERGEIIDRLRQDRKTWSQVIAVLERDHQDWPTVEAYRSARRTPEAFARILSWARQTLRRYLHWKRHA
jgi:hypothetical protein